MNEDRWFVKDKKGKERTGVLMRLQESEHSRYEFEVWFEYTRQAMNDIREGTMLVVPNYATTRDETHYSVIEVTSLKPIHYAIGENPAGFPGFVMEAAKNAAQDWTGQDDEPTEDTTTIQCTAIPTNLELVERRDGRRIFQTEENIPMVGAVVRILDTEPTEQVVNRDIDLEAERDRLFVGGTLVQNTEVKVYVRIEELIHVHLGVFGFTGVGKSNLLSTYIARLLSAENPVKMVLFDLMGEYTGLLIDMLNNESLGTANVVALQERTFPGPVVEYLNRTKGAPDAAKAAEFLNRVTLLPKRLQREKPKLRVALERLLREGRVRIFSEVGNLTMWYLFWDYKNNPKCPLAYKTRRATRLVEQRKMLIRTVLNRCVQKPRDYKGRKDYKRIVLNKQLAGELLAALKEELDKPENREFHSGSDFQGVIDQISSAIPLLDSISPAALSIGEMVTHLNDEKSGSSLYIIQAHDPDEMRRFAAWVIGEVYEARRRSGQIRPLVSFIFDEADEFVPLEASGTYETSKTIIATLTRRGRKFGLGVGIATQRARYLDTTIMAQLHTYLVSKLPRKSDRDAVAEAFGISEDMFRQTFKFKPGNWLLVSHDATGLKAVPVPVQTEDANERIKGYLASLEPQEPKVEAQRLL